MATKVITNTAMGGDVSSSSPTTGQRLLFNGTNWVNDTSLVDYGFSLNILSASVLTLFTIPVQIAAAPGANKFIQLTSIAYRLIYNSVPYATDLDLIIKVAAASSYQSLTNNILGQTTSVITVNDGMASGEAVTNSPLIVTTLTENPTAGNSVLQIYGSYKIVTLL
jgi:hypothetical protein